ncbi:MAG: Rrf2 family transcriptional regulator [Patescibacteria group bacterium]
MQGFFRIPARLHLGLILMTELAMAHERQDARALSLREVAERMKISEGFLEEIAASLKQAGLIVGVTGPKGGYRLAKPPDKITARDIVTAIEGPVHLVDCHGEGTCPVENLCQSKNLWNFLRDAVDDSLKAKKLTDLC